MKSGGPNCDQLRSNNLPQPHIAKGRCFVSFARAGQRQKLHHYQGEKLKPAVVS